MIDIKVSSVKKGSIIFFGGNIHLFGLAKCSSSINTLGTITHVSKAGITTSHHYMHL
jgi:hypothetical protein